jgi:hypothetical protein
MPKVLRHWATLKGIRQTLTRDLNNFSSRLSTASNKKKPSLEYLFQLISDEDVFLLGLVRAHCVEFRLLLFIRPFKKIQTARIVRARDRGKIAPCSCKPPVVVRPGVGSVRARLCAPGPAPRPAGRGPGRGGRPGGSPKNGVPPPAWPARHRV